ncbi:MAG: hypothetical protein HYY37_04445 [Candidatus Aenigmarchaeota archaeon]|nr:hypothetical protein [Candidatus Aenigmarchaeota archaeon]
MTSTPYIRDVISAEPRRLDSAVKAMLPPQLTARWSGNYREPGNILMGDEIVGQYATDREFTYSGRAALDPQFQQKTGLNPDELLDRIAKVFG